MLTVLSSKGLAPSRWARGALLLTRCTASPRRASAQQQAKATGNIRPDVAPYIPQGLPMRIASLLSGKRIPRVDIAAQWVATQKEKDTELELERSKMQTELLEEKFRIVVENSELVLAVEKGEAEKSKLVAKAAQKEALQRWVTKRYLKLAGLWSPLGILDFAEKGVVLPSWPPAAPKLPVRQQKWKELMANNPCLEESICLDAQWKDVDIPMRMDAMYQRLSGYAHAQHMPIGDGIVIAEGPLYRDQMLALACVAKHFGVPHELMFGCGGTHCLGN